MRRSYCVTLSALLSFAAIVPAHAEAALAGNWSGPFNGVQIEVPVQAGPFGYENGEARTIHEPRFVESTLQINFETQQKGVVVGTWTAGQFKQRFVCAQLNSATWSCLDATGRASIEVTSASEIKVCYLDSRQGALGAGCALLKKAG